MNLKRLFRTLCAAGFLLALCGVGTAPVFAAAAPVGEDLTAMSLEELSNVQVTSVSRAPEKLMRAAAAIYVITQDDIRRSGATSIPEALRLAPGVEVARVNSNSWAIGIRGFNSTLSRSVLVMIDGRSVYSPLFAGTYWDVQDYPLEDIDRIEVIRGPGGTLYGANAVNGVINIFTKSAKETQGGMVTAGGGSFDRDFTSVRYGGKKGEDFSYRLYGKFFDRNASDHTNGDNYDPWTVGQTGFRTDWDASSRDNLTIQGDFYKGTEGASTIISNYSVPFVQTIDQDTLLQGANLLGRWKHAGENNSDSTLQWYYDRTQRNSAVFNETRDTVDLDFQNRLPLPWRQTLTWGTGYRLTADSTSTGPVLQFVPTSRTDNLGSAFAQDEIALVPDEWVLTLGSKLEHNDYSGWEVEPSGRLAWTPTDTQTVWAAASRAVRTPSQVEQNLQATAAISPTTPTFIRVNNNPDFGSEKLVSYELGYRTQPWKPLFVDLAGFYNQYDDLLSIEPGTPFLTSFPGVPVASIVPYTFGNGLQGETHGLELASTWQALDWWRLRFEYSLVFTNLHTQPGSLDTLSIPADEGSSPRHQILLQSSMDLPHHLELDPTIRYVDAVPSQNVPSYWNFDARLGWHATPHLELALVGQNLIQNDHSEFDPNQQIPRAVYGEVTWTW